MKKTVCVSLFLALVSACPAAAEVITLENGQTFEGEIVENNPVFIRIIRSDNQEMKEFLTEQIKSITKDYPQPLETKVPDQPMPAAEKVILPVKNYTVEPVKSSIPQADIAVIDEIVPVAEPQATAPPPKNDLEIEKESINVHQDYWPSGNSRSVEPLLNGVREGEAVYYHDNGKIYARIPWKNGQYDGQYSTYRDDGTIEGTCTYDNGIKEGLFQWYDEKGKLITEEHFKNNILHGPAIYYYTDGTLQSEINYQDGLMQGINKWYDEDGIILTEAEYDKGLLNGYLRNYYANGKIQEDSVYKDDQLNGMTKIYYEDGTLKGEIPYVNGIRQDNVKCYTAEGAEIPVGDSKCGSIVNEHEGGASRERWGGLIPFIILGFYVGLHFLFTFIFTFKRLLNIFTTKRCMDKALWKPETALREMRPRFVIRKWNLFNLNLICGFPFYVPLIWRGYHVYSLYRENDFLTDINHNFLNYCVSFVIAVLVAVLLYRFERRDWNRQEQILILGDVVCARIEKVRNGLGNVALEVTYTYHDRTITVKTKHNAPFGVFKKGQFVSCVVDPKNPESCVVYQASVYY